MIESRGCYLAEWYPVDLSEPARDDVVTRLPTGADLLTADGTPATVLVSLAVPADGVVFCVFAAASLEVVAAACAHHGIPTERITAAFVSESAPA